MGAEAKAKQEAADKAAAEKAAAEAAAVKKAEEEAKAKLAAEEARIRKAAEALAAKQKKAKEEAEAEVLAEANKIAENVQKNNTAPIAEIAETIIACDHLLEQCLWMEDNPTTPVLARCTATWTGTRSMVVLPAAARRSSRPASSLIPSARVCELTRFFLAGLPSHQLLE